MAPWSSSCRLVWNGSSSIPQILGNLARGQRTVIRLPTRFHPAVSERLYAEERVRASIDVVGDAQLLAHIAKIDGLHDLAELVTPMQALRTRLRVRSPAPHLVFNAEAAHPRFARPGRPRKLQVGKRRDSTAAAAECASCGVVHIATTRSPKRPEHARSSE